MSRKYCGYCGAEYNADNLVDLANVSEKTKSKGVPEFTMKTVTL